MSDNENWRTMPAGKELDELICRKVGWSVTTEPLGNSATLWRPDLTIVNTWISSEAWPYVVSIAWNNAPRYSRDLDAWNSHHFALWWSGDKWYASFDAQIFENALEHTILVSYPQLPESAVTPALAVCRAWLADVTDIEPKPNVGGDDRNADAFIDKTKG